MKKRTALFASVWLAVAFSFTAPADAGAPKLMRVTIADSGAGARMPGAAWSAIAPGEPIAVRSQVQSAAHPVRLSMPDGSFVELAANSQIQIAGLVDVALGKGGKWKALRVDLKRGEVLVRTAPKAQHPLMIGSSEDSLVAARGGATLRVRTRDSKQLTAAVYAGEASVTTTGAWKPVGAGFTVELLPKKSKFEAVALSAGPSWDLASGVSLGIVADDGRAPVALSWIPIENATGYSVEIARDASFSEIVSERELPREARSVRTEPLPVGKYFARARARGPQGLFGLTGPARSLRVARAILPPGARADAGVWTLPVNSPAKWEDPEGLEMSVSRGFSKAGAFELTDETPRLLRVRLAGERGWVAVRLAPSKIHADIEMSPKLAVWPLDPVKIQVRIENGDVPDPTVEPSFVVTVNLEEIPVTWSRDGSVWKTEIAPKTTAGPWVVRVAASDAHGNEIGRSFLEVASPKEGLARTPQRTARSSSTATSAR